MAWNPPSAWAYQEMQTAAKLNQLRESLIAVRNALGLFDGSTYLARLAQNNGAAYWGTTDAINSATPVTLLPAGSITRGCVVSAYASATGESWFWFQQLTRPGSGVIDAEQPPALSGYNLWLRISSDGSLSVYRPSGSTVWRISWRILAH